MFGTEMQEAVVQMIHAEARIKSNQGKFIQETTVKINGKPRAAIVNLKPEEMDKLSIRSSPTDEEKTRLVILKSQTL